jgi:hypothetical protein
VTDRNRAAVDVQFCVVDAQLALAGEGLRGERLVQLEQVDAVEPVRGASRFMASAGSDYAKSSRALASTSCSFRF